MAKKTANKHIEDIQNLELRSDKVRSIIGQIPHWIIRSGITIISIIIIVLLLGSFYFKYPYTITTVIEFVEKQNSFVGIVKIPANEISKVKKGQKVEVYFENVKNLRGVVFKTTLSDIPKEVEILNKKGLYLVKVVEIENLTIRENTNGIAKILTNEMSFFERITKPFKVLKSN